MKNMFKVNILSITHITIILKKTKYLNKLLNQELMKNTRLQYNTFFQCRRYI